MKSLGPGPGIIVPFALFTDLLNQSPPDLELKESSENYLEKNIGICFFYRLFFNKTSCNSKKKRYSQALC